MSEFERRTTEENQQDLMNNLAILNAGEINCHWDLRHPVFLESMEGIETSTLAAAASCVQLGRLDDLSGNLLFTPRGRFDIDTSYEIENAQAYQDQLFDLAKGLHPYKGRYVNLFDRSFDVVHGLIGEALFYAVGRKVGAPITITGMGEDYGRGRDIEIQRPQGSLYLDITTKSSDSNIESKFAPDRDASVFLIPLRRDSLRNRERVQIIQRAVTDLFRTPTADTPEEGLANIAYGVIDYDRITFEELGRIFNIKGDIAKVVWIHLLGYAEDYLKDRYDDVAHYREWPAELKEEYERRIAPIRYLQELAT